MMHVVVIPDSFKGSLSAREVAQVMYGVLQSIFPKATCTLLPFSDGGEGALDVLKDSISGQIINCQTVNAIGKKISAPYFLFENGNSAWIELSQSSGLTQLHVNERDPLVTSTLGTGLQIKDALNKGCENIYLGVGGSCTHDMGTGIFTALGGRLLNHNEQEVQPCGGNLTSIESLDFSQLSPLAKQANWIVACDVTNPLVGPKGAAFTYAIQKGADDAAVQKLEDGSMHLGNLLINELNCNVFPLVGGGAAGGVSAGLFALFGSKLENGFDILSKITNLEIAIQKADLVLTGEGCFDQQSMHGKLPYRVAKIAQKHKVITYIVAGQAKEKHLAEFSSLHIFQTKNDNMSTDEAMHRAAELLETKLVEIFNNLKI
jgi:glycerate kinase